MKEHYIYKITNNINGKFYYGKRSCKGLAINDNRYMGSGKHINRAKEKYGIENFTKEILAYCDSSEDTLELEEMVVTQKEVNDPMCYNIKLGGLGGCASGENHWMYGKESPLKGRPQKLTDEQIAQRAEHAKQTICKPENVKKAGEAKRQKNRIYEYDGKMYSIRDLHELTGISEGLLDQRIRMRGWSVVDAINKPAIKGKKYNGGIR